MHIVYLQSNKTHVQMQVKMFLNVVIMMYQDINKSGKPEAHQIRLNGLVGKGLK